MKLTIHPQVAREIEDAVDWYDDQSLGLGDDFLLKLEGAKSLILQQPQGHSFWLGSKTIRRARLKRFPYVLLFRVTGQAIRILCLRHDKRHPSYGLDRH
jgi:plasmid stabilization system protein ParE